MAVFSRMILSTAVLASVFVTMGGSVDGKLMESSAQEHSRQLSWYSYWYKGDESSDDGSSSSGGYYGGSSSDSGNHYGSRSGSGSGSGSGSSSGSKDSSSRGSDSDDSSSSSGGFDKCKYWWSKWFKSCQDDEPEPEPERYARRLNCGGNGYEDYDGSYRYFDQGGNLWYSDFGYFNDGAEIENVGDREIYDTDDDELYRTSRFIRDGDLVYTFSNINNGRYFIKLRFAEVFFESSGERVFDIVVNDEEKELNVDIYDRVGKDTSLILEYFNLEIRYNTLEVRFRKVLQDPKCSGIEVYQVGDL